MSPGNEAKGKSLLRIKGGRTAKYKVWRASRGTDVMNHDLGMARQGYFTRDPVTRITTNPETCIALLMEKLPKNDWSLAD